MLLSIFFQCTTTQVHLGMADWARLFNECWRWAGLVCSWDPGRGSCICICIMHTHYPYSRSLSLSLTHFGLPSRSGRHYPALTSLSFRISYICVHGVFSRILFLVFIYVPYPCHLRHCFVLFYATKGLWKNIYPEKLLVCMWERVKSAGQVHFDVLSTQN